MVSSYVVVLVIAVVAGFVFKDQVVSAWNAVVAKVSGKKAADAVVDSPAVDTTPPAAAPAPTDQQPK